jgi:hypothetical protein
VIIKRDVEGLVPQRENNGEKKKKKRKKNRLVMLMNVPTFINIFKNKNKKLV